MNNSLRESLIGASREHIRDLGYTREELTATALWLSLCPLHLIDYAICFDDNDPECAAIRTVHPGHDT